MSAGWICAACGNHYPGTEAPPASCLICTDERQWVAPSGQRWTTMAELATAGCHCDLWEEEPGLLGVAVNPPVGIGQRGPAKTRFGILPRKPRPCPRHWLGAVQSHLRALEPGPAHLGHRVRTACESLYRWKY